MENNNLQTVTIRVLVEVDDLDHSSEKLSNEGFFKVIRLTPCFLQVKFGRGCTFQNAVKNAILVFEYTTKTKVVSYDISNSFMTLNQ